MTPCKLNDLNSGEDRIASIPVNKRMWEKMKEKYFEGVFRVYESVGVRNEQLKIYCLSDLLKYIKPMLPREVFVRQMHPDRVNGESVGNTKFVLVELVKWSYDSIDGIRASATSGCSLRYRISDSRHLPGHFGRAFSTLQDALKRHFRNQLIYPTI